jgi:hypothetical protein
MKHEFAIKQEILFNGEKNSIPLVRVKSTFTHSAWARITEVEGRLIPQDIDWQVNLSFDQCKQRIDDYKKQLLADNAKRVQKTEIIKIQHNGTLAEIGNTTQQ